MDGSGRLPNVKLSLHSRNKSIKILNLVSFRKKLFSSKTMQKLNQLILSLPVIIVWFCEQDYVSRLELVGSGVFHLFVFWNFYIAYNLFK